MAIEGGAAFLSYSHEDDRLDDGGIVRLMDRIAAQYALSTGRDLTLFVDRDIGWGDEWRVRIDDALIQTTFLIPILTPRYFTREECRKELVSFHSQATSLGVRELLLPILYVPIVNFNENNGDELIALASRYQYADWTQLRLEDSSSKPYRGAVHSLAERLASASALVADRQLTREIVGLDEEESAAQEGLHDLAERINAQLPAWLEAIEQQGLTSHQYAGTSDYFDKQDAKLRRIRGSQAAGARLALLQRRADSTKPLAESELRSAEVYHRLTLELEPSVLAVLRLAREDSSIIRYFHDFGEALEAANGYLSLNKAEDAEGRIDAGLWWSREAKSSRLARQVAGIFAKAEALIDEANGPVEDWVQTWGALLLSEPAGGSGAPEAAGDDLT